MFRYERFPVFSMCLFRGTVQRLMEMDTIANLYPEFTKKELEEAEANLRRYLAVLLRISDRLAKDGRSINDLVDCRFADPDDQVYHPTDKGRSHQNH